MHPHIGLELFWTVFTCNWFLICAYFSPDSDKTAFSLEKSLLWIMDFLLHKTLTDGLYSCELLVDYCDVFISCMDSNSDGTHSLQRIHWWVTDAMLNLNQICSDEEPSSSTSHMAWGRVHFQQIFICGWTTPLIKIKCLRWNVTGLVRYSNTLYSRFIRNQTHVAFSSSTSLSFPPTDFVPVQARTHHQQTRNPAGADGRLWQRAYHQAAAAQSGERLIGCRRVPEVPMPLYIWISEGPSRNLQSHQDFL